MGSGGEEGCGGDRGEGGLDIVATFWLKSAPGADLQAEYITGYVSLNQFAP